MGKMYQLPLDETMDADIIKRLDEIPRARKAEWVRHALRLCMAIEKGASPMIPVNTSHVEEKKEEPKPEPEKPKKKGSPFKLN